MNARVEIRVAEDDPRRHLAAISEAHAQLSGLGLNLGAAAANPLDDRLARLHRRQRHHRKPVALEDGGIGLHAPILRVLAAGDGRTLLERREDQHDRITAFGHEVPRGRSILERLSAGVRRCGQEACRQQRGGNGSHERAHFQVGLISTNIVRMPRRN